MSTLPTAAARIEAQQRSMKGQDIICSKCGSGHFYEVQVSRYLTGGSGSVEILQDTNEQTHSLLKCAGCDFPVLPKPAVGRRSGGVYETSHKMFRESITKGQDYITSNIGKGLIEDVLEGVAGKHIEGAVEDLRDRVNVLEAAQGEGKHSAETPQTKEDRKASTQFKKVQPAEATPSE